ncbi:MAG: hypothetical protein WBA25_17815, partial [Jannaschia sp.]
GYETRAAERGVAELERQIVSRQRELSMLRAEWAYLNRPDRLHALAEMNFESLGLMALSSDHFAQANQVAYPPPPQPAWPRPWETASVDEEEVDGVIIMGHSYGADAAPTVIAPPRVADDGEQLP